MALAPSIVTGYALGVLSVAILITKAYFINIKPSHQTTKHLLSTKLLEFSPLALSFCWVAYHVTCQLTLATSLDPPCDELDQMMNPDIGGIGARVGIYAPQITTMISMGVGHWHNTENGVKETCIVNLIVLASLMLNTLKGFYKSLHVTEILVACYSIDGVHAAITMAFAEKRTLASRWLISISVLTQLSAKITVAVAVGHLPSVERRLDCSIRTPFYGTMFYANSWNPATL
ncbi:hypothetical protein C7974DRAFT_186227 [Boeremia exigua]|uniref:uncharacterized protein n=1 Tax=Boeremia exigua TaxID=749465 RepID=UPI001E8E8822|nr:uncharacterized protein C7974DRAFT_186227 [Boeremia exigua]KAH6629431.1 hypothetical protein C7974DRAFT_186227 [Boeremia exigua]